MDAINRLLNRVANMDGEELFIGLPILFASVTFCLLLLIAAVAQAIVYIANNI